MQKCVLSNCKLLLLLLLWDEFIAHLAYFINLIKKKMRMHEFTSLDYDYKL